MIQINTLTFLSTFWIFFYTFEGSLRQLTSLFNLEMVFSTSYVNEWKIESSSVIKPNSLSISAPESLMLELNWFDVAFYPKNPIWLLFTLVEVPPERGPVLLEFILIPFLTSALGSLAPERSLLKHRYIQGTKILSVSISIKVDFTISIRTFANSVNKLKVLHVLKSKVMQIRNWS